MAVGPAVEVQVVRVEQPPSPSHQGTVARRPVGRRESDASGRSGASASRRRRTKSVSSSTGTRRDRPMVKDRTSPAASSSYSLARLIPSQVAAATTVRQPRCCAAGHVPRSPESGRPESTLAMLSGPPLAMPQLLRSGIRAHPSARGRQRHSRRPSTPTRSAATGVGAAGGRFPVEPVPSPPQGTRPAGASVTGSTERARR